jgi:2-iminobutanoate/2-iminopropanoate deaminase
MSLNKKIGVVTDKAPSAIGPYSQAIRTGNFLFISGQIPLDPTSGTIKGSTIVEQTERVMTNLLGVLASQGLGFDDLVKTTVYLSDMNEFTQFNETYARFLKAPFPARATVEVGRLPKDVKVEIDGVAVFPNA